MRMTMTIKLEVTVGSEEEKQALLDLIEEAECEGQLEEISVREVREFGNAHEA
jgi:hypothetical protein